MIAFPEKYSVPETLKLLADRMAEGSYKSEKKRKINFHGHRIKIQSQRYRCFLLHGTTCAGCGLVASFFRLERHHNQESFHLNMYGVENGNEILFTKDHIVPVSAGGRNYLSNLQTMCVHCNQAKGTRISGTLNAAEMPKGAKKRKKKRPTIKKIKGNLLHRLQEMAELTEYEQVILRALQQDPTINIGTESDGTS